MPKFSVFIVIYFDLFCCFGNHCLLQWNDLCNDLWNNPLFQIFWSWQVTYLPYSVCLLLPLSGPLCLSMSFPLSLTMFLSLSLVTDFVKIDVFQQIDDSVLYRFPHLLTRFICPLMVLAYYVKQAGHVCWVVEKAEK